MSNLPFGEPLTPPNPAAPKPRTCRHPRQDRRWGEDGDVVCTRCGKTIPAAVARRGRTSRRRGLSVQREVAQTLEMEHIPGNGPADARDVRFYAEVKSGPAWYSTRVEAELDNLPTDTGRAPLFVAASTPGPGHGKRRVYVTLALGDLVQMVGPHAQVNMWAPEWVALKKTAP